MTILINILIGCIALEHIYILYIEMFAWETLGKKTFKEAMPASLDNFFTHTKLLAGNQGLYNGFLAAGLIWTFFISNDSWKTNVAVFFLICVMVAGIYGAVTTMKKIFFTQALPAMITLVCMLLLHNFHN